MCAIRKLRSVYVCFVVIVLGISGCETERRVNYEHEQSAEFYNNRDIESFVFDDFRDNDILFVVDIKKNSHTSYIFWLSLYSKKAEKHIQIESAVLKGGDWSISGSYFQQLHLDNYLSEYTLFRFDNGFKRF